MPYQVTKNPWLGAILVFIFGPLGFLYYSWQKAVVTFFLFLLPNMMLYPLSNTVAEVVRWAVQILMAIYALFDLKGELESLAEMFAKAFVVVTIPIMLLNFFGGIVSGIWLIVLGQWKLVLLGFFVSIIIPYVFSLTMIIQMPLMLLVSWAESKGFKAIYLATGFLNILIGHALIVLYGFAVINLSISASTSHNISLLATLLFGYGVATGPFSYMASKEPSDSYGSILAAMVGQLSYITFAVAYLFGHAEIAWPIVLILVFGVEAFQLKFVSDSYEESRYYNQLQEE